LKSRDRQLSSDHYPFKFFFSNANIQKSLNPNKVSSTNLSKVNGGYSIFRSNLQNKVNDDGKDL